MRRVVVLFIGCVLLFGPASALFAQESEESEVLDKAIHAPTDNGSYNDLNKLPESLRKSRPFVRLMDEIMRRSGVEGTFDLKAREAAFEESKQHLFDAAYKQAAGEKSILADAWTNIGPSNRGGCTKGLAVDPSNSNIVYAGAAGGGVWKTTNAGSSWTPLTDLVIPDLATCSVTIDPQSSSTVYVGSGDGSLANDALAGTGLYKSTDGGSNWAKTGSTWLSKTVNKVLVHPSNSNIVFAANFDGSGTNGKGLYRSTNGGSTFTRVFPASKNADGVVWDVVPGTVIGGKTIFYLVEGNNVNAGSPSTECGIYKSIDDGATWGKISSTVLPAGNLIGKAALACPRLTPAKLYCFMATVGGDLRGLYRSTDNGLSFSSITAPSSIFNPSGNGAQGWYDLCMAISPNSNSQDTLLIGGVEAYSSFNGGDTWTSYSDYNGNSSVHVDHHAITFDPAGNKRVYIGTDGGVYKSTNSGSAWSYIQSNVATMRFYHLGLDRSDYRATFAGAQDQGTWRTYSGQSAAFKFGGDGFQPIVNPTTPATYYCEGPFGDLYRTTNNGSNFSSISSPSFEGESEWDTPFIMAPKSSSTLFTGRTQVWRSTDQGDSWASISPQFGNPHIMCLAQSPSNANVIYAGLLGGQVRHTTDGGTNWSSVNTSSSATVTSIVCHPRDESWALLSLASTGTGTARLMKTTNGGTTWTNVSGSGTTGLPGCPVSKIALDSNDPGNIWYAATDNGIYYTRNAGVNWSIAGSGLGLSSCKDVQVHANKITIRVATHGRSMWEANAGILPVELSSLTATRTSSGTQLKWTTDSERQNSGFWVQRSYQYDAFEDLEFIQGAGISNVHRSYSYFDPKHDDGYYIYRLKQIDLDGAEHLSNIVEVRYGTTGGLRLDQNNPNPFVVNGAGDSRTKIKFSLAGDDAVTFRIYSTTGQLVRTLFTNVQYPGGEDAVYWDGTDDSGAPVPSGAYHYVLELASGGKIGNKMIVLHN
jgi:hypothetical protein